MFLKFENHPSSFVPLFKWGIEVQKVKGTFSGSPRKIGVNSQMDLMFLDSWVTLLLCTSGWCHPSISDVEQPGLKAENTIPERTPKCNAQCEWLESEMDLKENPWNLWKWQHLPFHSYEIFLRSSTMEWKGCQRGPDALSSCPSQRFSGLRQALYSQSLVFFICKGGGTLMLILPAVPEMGSDHRQDSEI